MKRAMADQMAICVALFLLAGAGTAPATKEGPVPITDCTTITEPGSYVVTKNINATPSNLIMAATGATVCIFIKANFVTFDLAGFAITASNLGSTLAFGLHVDVARVLSLSAAQPAAPAQPPTASTRPRTNTLR